jgi:bifunctional non-homologous end joining protein LigD
VASSLADWVAGRSMVLDGEMVVTDESGKTDFQALQEYMKNPKSRNLTYIVFDLLALDGADLRDRRLIDRKRTLEALMTDAPHNLHYSRHVSGNGEECFAVACEKNMEGIIGKRANSIYSGTRNGDWIKIKCDKRQEFVIGGYTLSDKKAGGISSLLLGVYEDDELVYVGRAGTGLARSDVEELTAAFANLKREDSPFRVAPKQRSNEKITWLEPQLIAEIKFAEWTKENLLRQASYKGLRYDKNTEDIRREKVNEQELEVFTGKLKNPPKAGAGDLIIEGVKITNPEKILFEDPGITKGDVVRYYEQVAERMLPYVSNRILSIVRCPKGISQTCFYKKHPGPSNKGIVTIPVTSDDGKSEEYFFIKDKLGLIYEAQMGTLEFHVWGSKIDEIEYPDMMVFDLDPDEGMDLSIVRQGVRDLKVILDELSLVAFLKTSGGKGYHIVVPFNPVVTWDVFNDFARRVAEVMEKKWPNRYTSNVRKAKRAGRIFIDWIRNGRGATSIAPYSLRARKGAKVSMPIDWDELDEVAPDGVDMSGALKRIRGHDPWKDFFRYDQKLQR